MISPPLNNPSGPSSCPINANESRVEVEGLSIALFLSGSSESILALKHENILVIYLPDYSSVVPTLAPTTKEEKKKGLSRPSRAEHHGGKPARAHQSFRSRRNLSAPTLSGTILTHVKNDPRRSSSSCCPGCREIHKAIGGIGTSARGDSARGDC